jgi:oligopeptide transport system substrate-binding protein
MDPTRQADSVSGFWLGHLYEGLMTYDQTGNIVPGTAASAKVSADGKTWTFVLRKTAKWHDGKAVRAQDFEYAMKRLVDPVYASEYSFISTAAGLKNAEAILAKKMPPSALGVRAINDGTLEVELSRPVPYFDSLMAFQIFFPVRRDLVDKYGDKFASIPESIVGNGPFKLASWQKEQSLRIVKADTYWNAATIKLTAIESPSMVKDTQATFNNFQTGGIDITNATTPEVIKQAQAARLKIETAPTGCVDYISLNVREGRPFQTLELRQALRAGISRAEYVNKIVGVPGYKPSLAWVPSFLPGSKPGSTYRREAPAIGKDGEVTKAQQLVGAYLDNTKQTKVPSFTILSGDNSRAKKYAEYWQNSLARIFNTEVKIETVPFKTRLQKARDGQFDVDLAGWCPDYRDAMTFMDLFTVKNENNLSGWKHPQYDALIESAANESDPKARVGLFAAAEAILATEVPAVPLAEMGLAYVVAPGLKGVRRSVFSADPDFRFAVWEQKKASH